MTSRILALVSLLVMCVVGALLVALLLLRWRRRLIVDARVSSAVASARCEGEVDAKHLSLLGEPDGIAVSGTERLTERLDELLGESELEYYYVEPAYYSPASSSTSFVSSLMSSMNPRAWRWISGYGHAAVRYRHNGVERVFNVAGDSDVNPSRTLFAFLTVQEYLYDVNRRAYDRSEQMGVYHRHIVGIRLSKIPSARLEALHQSFLRLFDRSAKKEVGFALFHKKEHREREIEYGNCAHWTSLGLYEAGLLPQTTSYPKELAMSLLARFGSGSQVQIINYERVAHSQRHPSYRDWDVDRNGPTAPHRPLSSLIFWDTKAFADAVLLVPPKSLTLLPVLIPPFPRSAQLRHLMLMIHYMDVATSSAASILASLYVLSFLHEGLAVSLSIAFAIFVGRKIQL